MSNLRPSAALGSLALRLATFYLFAWEAFGSDETAQFGYETNGNVPGPDKWGDTPEWSTCKTGIQQSPINIRNGLTTLAQSFRSLNTSYASAPAVLFISSSGVLEVEVRGGGSLTLQNEEYFLKQFHFHAPSEHLIDGVRQPLEMHLVHQTESGEIAVIGILFSPGQQNNTFLDQFWDKLPLLRNQGEKIDLPGVDVNDPQLHMGPTFAQYTGSLTTPPCTEPVTWTVVLTKNNFISNEQLNIYGDILPNSNARPVQALNGRQVRKTLGIFRP